MFIELHNISRSFGGNQALIDVNLHLEMGRVGLLGPNGAGKSTLIKILLGILAPSSGTGRVLDHDLASAGIALRRAIGYMPEGDALVPGMQGAEYVALAGELYGMARKQALRRAHEVLTYLDLGDARYRKLEEYSTGMKQRLKLAQALVHDPPVLLLDEPTSGMDPAGREGMLDLLVRLGKEHKKAILLSTHLLGDIDKVCDAVIILHQGRILCQGPVRELCQRRHDRYRLQIQGDPTGLLEELRLEDVRILRDNGRGEYRVQVPADWTTQAFFKLAQVHNVVLRGLQADDEDLEELFHRVIGENPNQAPP
ncbi:MAG: ABC transporter ATP-binding protein [Planctomycetes bacterium]|nr:ABC transporter ATP-binding protein [Planctomycetota bacterium]